MFHRPKTAEEQSEAQKASQNNQQQQRQIPTTSGPMNVPAFVQKTRPVMTADNDTAPQEDKAAPAQKVIKNANENQRPTTSIDEEKTMNTTEIQNQNIATEKQPTAPQRPVHVPSYGPSSISGGISRSHSDNLSTSHKLTIAAGITMSGEIQACEHLIVEGNVEAALKGARVLEVSETGAFFGTVEIEEATIAGRFEGDITVNGRLTISSTGTIIGSITYKELAVEAGAVIDGRISPILARSEQQRPVQRKAQTESQPQNDNENELPFARNAEAAE